MCDLDTKVDGMLSLTVQPDVISEGKRRLRIRDEFS
jgi:hypothetical protein